VKTQERDEKTRLEEAREYVERQLAIMKEYGSAPKKLSASAYKELIRQVADATR
jgi:hypothetical protein